MAPRCDVVGELCQIGTRCKCFACGLYACRGCTRIMDWYRYKRKRVCDRCREESERFEEMKKERKHAR